MKTLLSCDHVFETLTRGPFPAGGPDDATVEQHLAACHDCRCLAEALRPAATLFHESLSAVEQEALPAYDGLLARLTQEVVAERATGSLPAGANSATNTAALALRFGSAMLLAVSLCVVLMLVSGGFANSGGGRKDLAALPIVRTVYHPNNERLMALASERLPGVCFPRDWKPDVALTADLACCSQCHASGAQARNACAGKWNHSCTRCHESANPAAARPRLFALLAQSCLACHDS